MHPTFITTLAFLAVPAVLGDHIAGIQRQNHASFVRVKRGGAIIHLVGDETVAQWSAGQPPAAPSILSTAAATATSYTNILDSINAGLGIPPSMLTVTNTPYSSSASLPVLTSSSSVKTPSSLSSSLSSAAKSLTAKGVAITSSSSASSSTSLSSAVVATTALNTKGNGPRNVDVNIEDCNEEVEEAFDKRAADTSSTIDEEEEEEEEAIYSLEQLPTPNAYYDPEETASPSVSYSNLLESIDAGLGIPMSLLTDATYPVIPTPSAAVELSLSSQSSEAVALTLAIEVAQVSSSTMATTSANVKKPPSSSSTKTSSSLSSKITSTSLTTSSHPSSSSTASSKSSSKVISTSTTSSSHSSSSSAASSKSSSKSTSTSLASSSASIRLLKEATGSPSSATVTSMAMASTTQAVKGKIARQLINPQASDTYSNLLESIDAMADVPMSFLNEATASPSSPSPSQETSAFALPAIAGTKADVMGIVASPDINPVNAEESYNVKERRILALNATVETFEEDHQVALGRRATANVTSVLSPSSATSANVSADTNSTTLGASAIVISAADQATAQGWGTAFANKYTTMSVQNHAVAGASTRSFYRELWPSTLATIKSGDYVVLEFGHYDTIYPGSVADHAAGCVGTVNGYGTGTQTVTGCNGAPEIVQTYNTYLSLMCQAIQAKGANCIISSMTPRNLWARGDTVTYVSSLPGYAKQAASAAGMTYFEHEESSVKSLNAIGQTAATESFLPGNTLQPNVAGADRLALSFVAAAYCAGLTGLTSSFTPAAQALQGQLC